MVIVYMGIIGPCLEQLLTGTAVLTILGSFGTSPLPRLTHHGVRAGAIIHIFYWGSPVPGYYRPRQHPGGFSGDAHCQRQPQHHLQPGYSDAHKDLVCNYGPTQVSVNYIQF